MPTTRAQRPAAPSAVVLACLAVAAMLTVGLVMLDIFRAEPPALRQASAPAPATPLATEALAAPKVALTPAEEAPIPIPTPEEQISTY